MTSMQAACAALCALAGCGNDIGHSSNVEPDASGPPGSPLVTVSAPRANDAYYPSDTVQIVFTVTDDDAATVTCAVDAIAETTVPIARDLTVSTGGSGTAAWSLAQVAPGTYRARVACSDANALEGLGLSGTFTVTPPPQQVSYATQIQPLWNASCTSTACHDAQAPAGMLDLTSARSYAALYDVASGDCATTKLVKPGAPDQSYLVHKLVGSGPCFIGTRMPKSAPAFSAAQIQLIRDWIVNGAPNN